MFVSLGCTLNSWQVKYKDSKTQCRWYFLGTKCVQFRVYIRTKNVLSPRNHMSVAFLVRPPKTLLHVKIHGLWEGVVYISVWGQVPPHTSRVRGHSLDPLLGRLSFGRNIDVRIIATALLIIDVVEVSWRMMQCCNISAHVWICENPLQLLQVTANESEPERLYNYEQCAFVHFYLNPSSSPKNLPLSLHAIKTSRVWVPLSGAILHHFQKYLWW